MDLYDRWKHGETIRVRTVPLSAGEPVQAFEIRPERFFDTIIMGYTLLIDGEPVPGRIRRHVTGSEFLDWCEHLEAVE